MAKLPKNKKMPKKKKGNFYGGLGGYKGVNKKKVKRLTDGVIVDEVRSLRRQHNEVNREHRKERAQAQRDYQRGRGDLRHVFGESGKALQGLRGNTRDTFANERGRTNQATAALQSQLGQTYNQAQSDGMSELARLGISDGGNFSQLSSDQANMQALAAQSGQNADSTIGMAGSNAESMMNMLLGMNRGSKASHMGKNLNRRNDAMAMSQQNKNDQLAKVRDAMTQAKGSRNDVFFQLLQQLQQTGWSQYMDQQNLKMQRRQLNKK